MLIVVGSQLVESSKNAIRFTKAQVDIIQIPCFCQSIITEYKENQNQIFTFFKIFFWNQILLWHICFNFLLIN